MTIIFTKDEIGMLLGREIVKRYPSAAGKFKAEFSVVDGEVQARVVFGLPGEEPKEPKVHYRGGPDDR